MQKVQVELTDVELATLETLAKKNGISVEAILARMTRDAIDSHKENKQ